MNTKRALAFVLTVSLLIASAPGVAGISAASSPGPAQRQVEGTTTGSVPEVAGMGAASEPSLSSDVSADWWGTVQADIRQSEYHVTWQEQTYLSDLPAPAAGRRAGTFQAPNRAHNLRTYFTPSGIRVIPRTESQPSWEWGLTLIGYGYTDDVRPVMDAALVASANRFEYRRGALTEWYVNDERGLEQGFTLTAPPQPPLNPPSVSRRRDLHGGEGQIVLELALSGDLRPSAIDDGTAIEFTTSPSTGSGRDGGVRVLRYSDLYASDATGRPLSARLGLVERSGATGHTGHAIRITVDDTEAVYPITVDPTVVTAGWVSWGDQAGADYGHSVGTAGDVNGDGYADLVVGAPGYDGGQADEGRAYVYHGSATGLSATADWTAEGDQAGAAFGDSVGAAGDVNGDGYADVIVGAPGYDGGQEDEGRVYVYHGSSTGLPTGTADWTAEGDQAGAAFGDSVGTVGDVNDDGYADVVVGAPGYDVGQEDEGRAYVYHGSVTGLTTGPADWTAEGDQAAARFGASVGTAGDVNGDGFADLVVGAPYYDGGQYLEGRAYVYHGSASNLNTTANWTAEGDQEDALFGASVGTAGDVNGDGYADVIVGAPNYNDGEVDNGRAYVYHGSSTGLSTGPADWIEAGNRRFPEMYEHFGASVGTAGDVNGDGYADIVVGAPGGFDYRGFGTIGYAHVYHGGSTGLTTGAADWTTSDGGFAGFGNSTGTAGDVNGDGYADVVVGGLGRAYVYLGPLLVGPSPMTWVAESDQAGAGFGHSVSTAGDVNGDGYADVVVGAPEYDGGQLDEGRVFVYLGSLLGLSPTAAWTAEGDQAGAGFGNSVNTAGDVNGDGYADLVIGAPQYDGDQEDEGRAYVYHGSSTGLTAGPADWTAESDQADAFFGHSVGMAGDVNGDGYADVIVGASHFVERGQAFVYHGSPSGLSTSADWMVESDRHGSLFGHSVGAAGDVNGDGYADVIVGAPYENSPRPDTGWAHVYHGGSSGLTPGPADWIAKGNPDFGASVGTAGDVNGDGYADVIVGKSGYAGEERAYVYHGSSAGLTAGPADWTVEGVSVVGTAGDVNGDGYADVVVGSPNYEGGQEDEGRADVYHGSSAGLTSGPADWSAEGDQQGARFGSAVAAAGDVNGDGYADVIVGAPGYDNGQTDEGRAYVYYGSPSTLSTTENWAAESDQPDARFGSSVGTAGDVNGDGYADVVVGAPYYDGGQEDEGRVYVYHGSATGLSTGPADWIAEGDQVGARFGSAVGTAGDVNGDGYADVVVGAPGYDGGQEDEGRVYVYHGSAAGLSTTAAWTAEGDQEGAVFGYSVGTAGDVNGDGYADLVVGAHGYDGGQANEGRATVYHGSASGLSATAAWAAEGDQEGASFGGSVGTAGDVNGDGYADVIVGGQWYSDVQGWEGKAYVYHGSASGLSATSTWTAECEDCYQFGASVGTAGDVNGDGYADVIVGSRSYQSKWVSDPGQVYAYHGSATGLNASASWGITGDFGFGSPAGTAGDVNGDGYADVIVGWHQPEGDAVPSTQVYLYHGSAAGLNFAADWTVQYDLDSGSSVGTAGDVNGDGYADVIVGAPGYLGYEAETAFVYYGNGGAGLSLAPRQMRSDGSAPIAPLGSSGSAPAVQLRLIGRSPLGREKVKLQWQVAPLGTPFVGPGVLRGASSSWTDTGTGGVEIVQNVSGLAPNTPYHWRVRLLYPAGNRLGQSASRWIHIPWNGWSEQDFRTGDVVYRIYFPLVLGGSASPE